MTKTVAFFLPTTMLFPPLYAQYNTEEFTEQQMIEAAALQLCVNAEDITMSEVKAIPGTIKDRIYTEPTKDGYKFRKEAI